MGALDGDGGLGMSDATDELMQLMSDLRKCDDTVWLSNSETVFERCWFIVEQEEGRDRLEEMFPEYA